MVNQWRLLLHIVDWRISLISTYAWGQKPSNSSQQTNRSLYCITSSSDIDHWLVRLGRKSFITSAKEIVLAMRCRFQESPTKILPLNCALRLQTRKLVKSHWKTVMNWCGWICTWFSSHRSDRHEFLHKEWNKPNWCISFGQASNVLTRESATHKTKLDNTGERNETDAFRWIMILDNARYSGSWQNQKQSRNCPSTP